MGHSIAYVKHPISAEAKAEIRAKGLRIIDARFAPDGAEIYGETPLLDQVDKPAPAKRGRPKKVTNADTDN